MAIHVPHQQIIFDQYAKQDFVFDAINLVSRINKMKKSNMYF